tara:strand:- start:949 stop:1395 length:447 start_codon:yes stop_codon:yes gene_type:complete
MSRENDIKLIKKNGFKSFKPDRHSFIDENGQRWLQCKFCCEYQKVDEGTGYITCGSCVVKIDLIEYPNTIKKQKVSTGRPAGWHFMNEFVDKDGNVFHKGKEQPDLKGTLPPTKVKPRKKKKKLSADEKLHKDIKNWKKRLKAKRGKK